MDDFPISEFRIPARVKKKLDDEKWLKKQLAMGKTAQEILKISDEEMDEYYNIAHHFFEKEKFSDAANVYLFLVTLNPRIHEYWVGLAMSTQMCGDYEGALDAYEMASLDEINDPVPYFYLAKCFFALHDNDNAMMALDLAVEMAADDEEYADIKKQALKAKKILSGKKRSKK